MEKVFLIKKELNELKDKDLEKQFREKNPIYGKVNYYPIFASRLPVFKNLLLDEAVDTENMIIPFFNFIKISWIPVICVLNYSEDIKYKIEIIKHIKKYWTAEDIDNFKTYIESYPDWLSLF